MHPARYHLTLAVAGRPVADGWWDSETVARNKATQWIGAWGRPGARITLTDEETGRLLTTWPEEP
jgi:hypothetical protein